MQLLEIIYYLHRFFLQNQAKLARRDPDICQDQLQSKCSRLHGKFGTHHVFGTDNDVGNIVEFAFRPTENMTVRA